MCPSVASVKCYEDYSIFLVVRSSDGEISLKPCRCFKNYFLEGFFARIFFARIFFSREILRLWKVVVLVANQFFIVSKKDV
jgi:hypothetical protein